jgi:hypothetical protein
MRLYIHRILSNGHEVIILRAFRMTEFEYIVVKNLIVALRSDSLFKLN